MLRSIRWTLQLWHAGILGVALASFGTALYIGVSHAEYQRVDAELESAARTLASTPIGPGGPNDPNRPPGRRGGGGGGGGGFRGQPGDNGFDGPGGQGGGFGGGQGSPFAQDQNFSGPSQGGFGGSQQGGFNGPPQRGFGGQQQDGFGGGPGFGRGGPNGFGGPDQRGIDLWNSVPQDALRRIGENEQDQPYFAVWALDGRILRESSATLDVPTEDDQHMPLTRGPWAAVAPVFRTRGLQREVIVQAPNAAHVLVGKSLASVRNDLFYLRWELFGAGLAVMAIGLCGGWWLAVRATRPISAISKTAREISGSDLSKRVEIKESASELGMLATTLNETFDRLQTAFDRQVRFTGDASHELRTPLSVIHSQAELALSRERDAGEYKKSLETVLRAAKRMKSLVESLLVLARADAGKLTLNLEKFDLVETAEECVAMVTPRAAERQVTITTDLHPMPVDADRTRMMQLMTNLLVNAVQYNVVGGKVELFVGPRDGEAVISVTDTGVGIPPEKQPQVFERFFRADEARSREVGGSGLGLAICQSIVEAHGGTITFTSKVGKGTTFLVRLPVQGQTAEEKPPEKARE
jgi:heavy metal sensor kinase